MEYGCIGEKLGHSFSKIIHGKLMDYNYELCEIPKGRLTEFMERKAFKAINVTIPYKQDVIPFLDEIDDTALKIGAVNTIVNNNGRLSGYNTDFLGMLALIDFAQIDVKGKKVLIAGSGGTSKTAFAVAEYLGASEIYRLSRREGKGVITYNEAEKLHNDAEIIINTTPCGMYPNIEGTALNIDKFPLICGVVDAVYNPLCSQLVRKALKKGITAVGGLYMLVAQAVFAAEKFKSIKINKSEIDRIYNEILSDKQNIVLIGMPSSGKTTLGKIIAEKTGKKFIDTDALITEKYGNIPDIFKDKGEEYFRELESEVIAEVSALQSVVIATGGGAILNPDNTDFLKANGIIIFIDRPLDKLITTNDRPLSSNREELKKRYEERYDIYCRSADYTVNADGDIKENTERIAEVIGL